MDFKTKLEARFSDDVVNNFFKSARFLEKLEVGSLTICDLTEDLIKTNAEVLGISVGKFFIEKVKSLCGVKKPNILFFRNDMRVDFDIHTHGFRTAIKVEILLFSENITCVFASISEITKDYLSNKLVETRMSPPRSFVICAEDIKEIVDMMWLESEYIPVFSCKSI